MRELLFLGVEQIEELHRQSLELFGGAAGLRDRSAFESAALHPRNVHFYGGGDVFAVATAYCFHLSQAQAFVDGNKRTGAAAAIVFLDLNGFEVVGDEMRIHAGLICAASGEIGKAELADLFREITAPRPSH